MMDASHSEIAEQLGLTEEEFDNQISEGKTVWQIAQEKGLSEEEIIALMRDARLAALDQLVSDGVITPEQADWMKQRGMGGIGGNGVPYMEGCPMWNQDESAGQSGGGSFWGRGMSRGGGMMRQRR